MIAILTVTWKIATTILFAGIGIAIANELTRIRKLKEKELTFNGYNERVEIPKQCDNNYNYYDQIIKED